MGEFLPGEALADDVQRFREPAARFRHGHAVSVVFGLRRAAAEAEMQGAPRQRVQHRDLFGDAHRMVPGQHQHRGAEPDIRAERGDMRHEEQRARRRVVVGEMVLQHPDRLVAKRLGELHVLDDLVVKHLVGLADIGGGRGLHAESHAAGRGHGRGFPCSPVRAAEASPDACLLSRPPGAGVRPLCRRGIRPARHEARGFKIPSPRP